MWADQACDPFHFLFIQGVSPVFHHVSPRQGFVQSKWASAWATIYNDRFRALHSPSFTTRLSDSRGEEACHLANQARLAFTNLKDIQSDGCSGSDAIWFFGGIILTKKVSHIYIYIEINEVLYPQSLWGRHVRSNADFVTRLKHLVLYVQGHIDSASSSASIHDFHAGLCRPLFGFRV